MFKFFKSNKSSEKNRANNKNNFQLTTDNNFKLSTLNFKLPKEAQPSSMILRNFLFNGEKNFKSLGIPLAYDVDYYGMANRAWNLYLTTDITKIIIDRLTQFTIGDGLKLQYEPDKFLLKKKYNIEIDHELIKLTESLWNIFSNSKYISNNNQNDIHTIATQVMINTLLCGDCLIIRRIKDGIVKLQVIDGRNVTGGTLEYNSNNRRSGNR
jgi:hypothetical protein